jgi:hypothetical protein
MPTFKQKSSKKLLTDTKNTITLDSMHKEKQAEFNYIQTEIIPALEKELVENKQFLKDNSNSNSIGVRLKSSKPRTELLDEVYHVRDRNIEIKELLKKHKQYIKNYYLTNNKYIFSYFEDKKDISETPSTSTTATTTTTSNTASANAATTNANAASATYKPSMTKSERIQTFFKIQPVTHVPVPSVVPVPLLSVPVSEMEQQPEKSDDHNQQLDNCEDQFLVKEGCGEPLAPCYVPKLTNLQHYLHNTGRAFFDYDKYAYRSDVCAWCNSGEMVAIESEGILVCNKCSNFTVYYVESDKPSYKEPPKEASFYAYRRINHFREILAQVQAKETTQIDNTIIASIKKQIRKERITLDQFTDVKAKEILKKLGYNKYYEHIPFIKEKLGIKPPVMSPELEETLCNLFMETQGPYARFCPDERVNFLNYYYTIYKLCELLGQTQYLPYFPMLKDRDKRIEQDEIWKKICKELKWEFIPTQ